MTNQIAVIDPYIKGPAVNCFNSLVELLGVPASYHMPSMMGMESILNGSFKASAYIVLGSASHVHENLPWQKPLADFLVSELKANKPVMGCCFGHQLVCHALGAKVEFHSEDEAKHMGSRRITISEDFWNFKKDESFLLGVTHKQVVRDLPKGLREVGRGLENDLVIHETLPFMGTQAHPEASGYFCTSDITNLQATEISNIQKDGGALIRRFFAQFKII
jgi:GMP synthase-like glutamine amidotransferase